MGDIDNDGDTDVLVANNNGPVRLLLNQVGVRQHWLGLRLIARENGRDMLGTQVEIVLSKDKILRRRVRTDGSYLSANDPRVLVGLGNATRIDAVRVRWPDGSKAEWKEPLLDRYITREQGQKIIGMPFRGHPTPGLLESRPKPGTPTEGRRYK